MNLTLLPEIAAFVIVVESGSFSAAARKLGATPSSVSRSISRLEKKLGVKLLHRTTRKLRLSDAGSEVLKSATVMLDSARLVLSQGGIDQQAPQGKLTLSVPKAVGRFVLHPVMAEFLARYPQVDICLRLEDRYMDLIDDGVDLALRITNTPSPGLHGKALMPITHLLCATPHYLAQHGAPQHPQDLRAHSCISLGETPVDSRWKFRQHGKTLVVQTHGRYAANHTGVRLDAVKQHLGIGSLPLFTAREALANGEIVQVLPEWEFISTYSGQLWLLWSAGRQLPVKMRVMIDYLAEKLAVNNR
ncbi:LysR family transcriptional regulator [Franconibacter daqui]|uniref:LysR family transcriptional regulator n=1 Tax=Franconibacter daqui TaxID=2047724 RepID=A0ABV1PRW9_9ENTR